MGSSLPISSLTSKTVIPYTEEVSAVTKSNSQLTEQGKPDPNAIQTSKELKTAELQGKPVTPGEKQIIKAIEKANKALQGAATSFEFSIHEKTHEIMVKVIDKDTGDIIREIPPEKTLDMVAKMWELAGIIVDKKA